MKKRVLKIFALLLVCVIVVFGCFLANAFFGNPISKALATRTAKEYLKANYADTDYVLKGVSFNFKDGTYFAHFNSPGNIDGDFTLDISMLGKPLCDDYDYRVTGRGNIALRLFFEYREKVDSVLESDTYPYTLSFGYGDLEFDREVGKAPIEGAITRAELVNNTQYDVSALGAKNGTLVLYVDTDEVTNEKASEILLVTKRLLDDAGISFYLVHLVLQYPPYDPEVSYQRPEGSVDLLDFLSSDIYEEGLLDRVKKCAEETRKYYDEQDKQK